MSRRRSAEPQETIDKPWKQIVPALFHSFVQFFAPALEEMIDWQRTPVFLDKEMQQIAKSDAKSHDMADFLVKVWMKDSGEEHRLLVHIELQSQWDGELPRRMFIYNVRTHDRYNRPVFSLAILADGSPTWRPDSFGYGFLGCEVRIQYPVVKLLDFADRLTELEESPNPFGLAVVIHLKGLQTHGDPESRLQSKTYLARRLFKGGRSRGQIAELLSFLDWILSLPEPMDDQFYKEYKAIEMESDMGVIEPSLARRARAEGEAIGRVSGRAEGEAAGRAQEKVLTKREDLQQLMTRRFGPLPGNVKEQIDQLADIEELDRLFDATIDAARLRDVPLFDN